MLHKFSKELERVCRFGLWMVTGRIIPFDGVGRSSDWGFVGLKGEQTQARDGSFLPRMGALLLCNSNESKDISGLVDAGYEQPASA